MSTASKQRTSTVKVGVLTVVSLTLLVFSLIWLRGRGLAGGTHYDVLFRDVNGMREGSAVQMMGIRVGFVDEIRPVVKNKRFYVNVSFTINKDLNLKIPKGSKLSIEQSGLIGEQFLEITPPQQREVTLTTFKAPAKPIEKGIPVKFLYEQGYLQVGQVEKVDPYKDGNLMRYRLFYRITLPGAEMPDDPLFELTLDKNGEYYLRILPREPLIAQAPDPNLQFTVENPMRLKRFLEIQMESAEALKLTNDKINQLLSEETIDSLHSTIKNTEVLTARATEVMDNANLLFQTTRQDLNRLVTVSEQLVSNVSSVSNNINEVIGDPKLKSEINTTIASLRESSNSMRDLLNDPALKETIYLTRDTSKNASELLATLRQTAQDRDLQNRMEHIVTQLDTSLTKLNEVLVNVDQLTDDKDQTMKGILEDTREAAKNMRELTGKFNGRFTLFKLLF
jgi:phospholipid/cholesterol/gamma-HCH transport system substrate-binding protein